MYGQPESALALAFRDNAAIDAVGRLRPDHLFDAEHQELFRLMLDFRGERRPISPQMLRSYFPADPLGGSGIIDRVMNVTFDGAATDAHDLAFRLIQLATQRRLQAQGEWLAQQVVSPRANVVEIIAAHQREIDALVAESRPTGPTMLDMPEAMSAAQEVFQSDDRANRIPTGLSDLDKATGGFGRDDLIILAGRPSMGKSATAVALGTNGARAGHGVLIFSLEMSIPAWMARMSSEATWKAAGSGIPYARALRHQLGGDDLESFIRAGASLNRLPLVIEAQTSLSIAEIAARTRKAAIDFERKGQRLGLVVVDHIGWIQPTKNYRGNRVMEVSEFTNGLANLAKSEHVAVLALCQLNRGPENRENKRPGLADLRDSGSIEQDADLVLLAYRPAYYLERAKSEDGSGDEFIRKEQLEKKRHVLEIGIAKQRNGETGTVELFVDMPFNVVRDLDRRRT